MASSNNAEHEMIENGDHIDLGKFLNERQSPNPTRDRIVENSQDNFVKNRQNSADADCLSRSQKERKLDDFLKHKRKRRKRTKITVSHVRDEAARILEEFLQSQLTQQAIQTSSPEYQRIVELSVTENTTPSGEGSSYIASSNSILREDSIPYADESDGELRKAESLQHEDFLEFQALDSGKLPIHHAKSKSAPHDENMWIQIPSRKPPGIIRPPPPPPPGTPHSPSENSSSGSNSKLHPVPYTGKTPDSSIPCSSDSLDTFSSLGRKPSPVKKNIQTAPDSLNIPTPSQSHSRSTTPITDNETRHRSPTKHSHLSPPKHIKPGSETSSDTDSEGKHQTHERKKKSMFKKAQHRVQNFLRNKKHRAADFNEDEEDGYDGSYDEKRPKHRKKHKKHDKEKHVPTDLPDMYIPNNGSEVLEERYIHRNKQINQTHSGGDGRNVLRSEDTTETVDIVNDKEKKHIEKRWKMKESSGTEGGVLGKLRRLTLRDKGKKNFMKESKSAHFGEDAPDSQQGASSYSRTISVPASGRPTQLGLDETDNANLTMYTNRRGFEFSNVDNQDLRMGGRHTTATQVVCREETEKDIRRHSSHFDIIDHSGNTIDTLYFDADGKELPKNKSFVLSQDEDIRERVVNDHGRIRVIRDVTHHDHMEMSKESADGAQKGLSKMTEGDKEELYGKIASRLACIGDNMMTEKEDQSSGAPANPSCKLSDDQKSSPEQGAQKGLSKMTEEEKEELYGKITSRLACIGDMMTEKEDQSSGASANPSCKLSDDQKSSPEQEFTKTTLTPLEIELRDGLREYADDMDAKFAANARTAALHMTGLVTYNHFKNIVQDSVGQEQGWARVAAVFHVTKHAIGLAGASGAMAMQIKEMSLKYIEDTFANWIVGQGGWESMLSGSESETESELD